MMANVVVAVNTSMSAAASTPVYLAMTGAAARSVICRGGFHPSPEVLPEPHVKGHRVDAGQRLLHGGFDVGDVGLVQGDVIAGGEPAEAPADEVCHSAVAGAWM